MILDALKGANKFTPASKMRNILYTQHKYCNLVSFIQIYLKVN